MQLLNPAVDKPTWSLDQRKMFEALVADYSKICYKGAIKPVTIRDRIKSKHQIASTYELSQNDQQLIITRLVDAMQQVDPFYTLQTKNSLLCH